MKWAPHYILVVIYVPVVYILLPLIFCWFSHHWHIIHTMCCGGNIGALWCVFGFGGDQMSYHHQEHSSSHVLRSGVLVLVTGNIRRIFRSGKFWWYPPSIEHMLPEPVSVSERTFKTPLHWLVHLLTTGSIKQVPKSVRKRSKQARSTERKPCPTQTMHEDMN